MIGPRTILAVFSGILALFWPLIQQYLEPRLYPPEPPPPSIAELVFSVQTSDRLDVLDESLAQLEKTLSANEDEEIQITTKLEEYTLTGSTMAAVYERRLERNLARTAYGETLVNQYRDYRDYVFQYLELSDDTRQTSILRYIRQGNSTLTRWDILAEMRSLEKRMLQILYTLGEKPVQPGQEFPPTWGDRVLQEITREYPGNSEI